MRIASVFWSTLIVVTLACGPAQEATKLETEPTFVVHPLVFEGRSTFFDTHFETALAAGNRCRDLPAAGLKSQVWAAWIIQSRYTSHLSPSLRFRLRDRNGQQLGFDQGFSGGWVFPAQRSDLITFYGDAQGEVIGSVELVINGGSVSSASDTSYDWDVRLGTTGFLPASPSYNIRTFNLALENRGSDVLKNIQAYAVLIGPGDSLTDMFSAEFSDIPSGSSKNVVLYSNDLYGLCTHDVSDYRGYRLIYWVWFFDPNRQPLEGMKRST